MSGTITDISPAYIEPSPDNPRREVGDVTELAQSIASVGVIEPLVVRPIGKKAGHEHYQVIVGHRRLAAASSAGVMWVPCIVRDYPEDQRAEIMLIENLQRVDLAPLEEAAAFQRLVTEFGWSQDHLAERIGRSQSHVSKRLALLQLPPKVHKALDSGGMTIGDALELTKLVDHPKRLDAAFDEGSRGAYGGIAGATARELREQADDERLEKTIERARKGKVPFVEPLVHQGNGHRDIPKGTLRLQGWGSSALEMTEAQAKKHAGEDCHAVTVVRDYQGTKVVEICTKPANHKKAKPKLSKHELAEREKRRLINEAHKARGAFFAEYVIQAKIPPDRLEQLVLDELLYASHSDVKVAAAKLLGVEPVVTVTDYGSWKSTNKNYAAPLREFAESSVVCRRKVMLAIVAAGAESLMKQDYYGWGPRQVEYIGLLQEHGYELTPDEERRLEKASPDDTEVLLGDDDEVTACRICGCTEDEPCEGGCGWVPDPEGLGDLCSRCLEENYAAGELEEARA